VNVMLVARPVVMLLIVALSALAPLASASPPDPIWMGGVFDGDDADDVIIAASSSEGVTAGPTWSAGGVVFPAVGSVPPAASFSSARATASSVQGRAPPTA
jgi:hypothetical protein